MSKSSNKTTVALVHIAVFGGTLIYGSIAEAQISFSSLQQWREPGAQRRAVEGVRSESPHSTAPDPEDQRREEQREERNRKRLEKELQAERKVYETQTLPIKAELSRITKSLQVVRVQPTHELKPHVDTFFGDIPLDTGKKPFGPILVSELGGVGTPASQIPDVNLRRAAALLESVGSREDLSEEDASYLAGESALEMEGAPLSVIIRDAPVGGEAKVRELVQQAQEIGALRIESERATTERLRIEQQLIEAQKEIDSGKGDSQTLRNQREKLLVSYKSAWTAETEKKAAVESGIQKVTIVWHSKTPQTPK